MIEGVIQALMGSHLNKGFTGGSVYVLSSTLRKAKKACFHVGHFGNSERAADEKARQDVVVTQRAVPQPYPHLPALFINSKTTTEA